MKNFFPMSRGDLCFIVVLLALAVVSFLPWTRNMQWAGMSMLGWMMVLLMVLSPTLALVRVIGDRTRSASRREETRR
jgi:hypothetical protein